MNLEYVIYKNFLSEDNIEKIYEKEWRFEPGTVVNPKTLENETDESYRHNKIMWLYGHQQEWVWLFDVIVPKIHKVNEQNWNFDLTERPHEAMQLARYEVGDYFRQHKDKQKNDRLNRNISLSIALNENYTGGELILENIIIDLEVGDAVLFPSLTTNHRVEEVTSGIRDSLVLWMGVTNFNAGI